MSKFGKKYLGRGRDAMATYCASDGIDTIES